MTLNEFTTLVYNNLASYIDDNTDFNYNDLSDSQLDAIRNRIRRTIRETTNIYDGNNFPLVVRDNISADLKDLANSAGLDLPSDFTLNFSNQLLQISDEQITQFYLVDDVAEQATETVTAPEPVDMDTRVQERINNSASEAEKDILRMVDSIAQEENFSNRAELLGDVSLKDSIIFGENKKVKIFISNTDTEIDYIVTRIIDGVEDDDFVVEVNTFDEVDSVHLDGARQTKNNTREITNDLKQTAKDSATTKHYFPRTNDEMQNLLSEYLSKNENNLSEIRGGTETIRTQQLYPNGPLITTNRNGHTFFNNHLQYVVNKAEIQSILDNATLSPELIAGNKKKGNIKSMSPIYKGGVSKYFKKLAQKPKGTRLEKLSKKPSYVLGYIFKAPNGKEHIVSLILSDDPNYYNQPNTIVLNRQKTKAGVTTNFMSFHPSSVRGYYPNIFNGGFGNAKNNLIVKSMEWFQGMLHIADLDNIILDQSPINGQVAHLYQLGDFFFDTVENANLDKLEPFDGGGGMIRIPNTNRELVDGWKVKINTRPEWRTVSREVEARRWTQPYNISMKAVRRKYKASQLQNSARHNALIALTELDVDNMTTYQIGDANRLVMRIAGLHMFDSDDLYNYLDSQTTLENIKYLPVRGNINEAMVNLTAYGNPKILAQALLNSTHLEKVTGIDVEQLDQVTKDTIYNFTEKIDLQINNYGELKPESAYKLFETMSDNVSPQVLSDSSIANTEGLSLEDRRNHYNPDVVDEILNATDTEPERSGLARRVQTEENARRSYDPDMSSFENLRQSYNNNVNNYTGFFNMMSMNEANIVGDYGLHVADSEHVSSYIADNNALVAPILEQGETRTFITDEARHLFVRNLQTLQELKDNTVLTADINYVGQRSGVHYIEFATVIESKNLDGNPILIKEYQTLSMDNIDDEILRLRSILRTHENVNDITVARAFLMMLKEYDITYSLASSNGNELDRLHPAGIIGQQMGVVDRGPESPVNRSRGTEFIYPTDPEQSILDQLQPNRIQENLDAARNQPRQPKVRNTDVSPQPFYTKMVFEDIRAGVNSNVNDVINLFNDLVDNKTTGAYSAKIYKDTTTNQVGEIFKRHGQPIQFRSLNSDFDVRNGQIPDDLFIADVTLVAPQKDFMSGVITETLRNTELNTQGEYTILGSRVPDSALNGEVTRKYDVAAETIVDLVEDDNLPRIRAAYSLGTDIGDGGADFNGIAFQPERKPVGNVPDSMTLRKLASSFAKTKTGKTLGLAWKTIDIGETLIAKGFAQAQKAAAVAGAATLGGVAAGAATLWAFYEISNLILAAGQQIPELRNVMARRNEILLNGEQWEKDFVEETFWQDYGPQLLEALQRAGDRSPSEILSDKIWSFTLDNLQRQSNGEVFEDALIDTSEELDIRDDLWYAQVPNDYKIELMQDNIDYDKVLTGYYNNRPEANVIMNRTLQLANDVYNRDR